MIETSVTYVRIQTSVNVLRIAASATTSGISTAGSVPKTKRRMISAPSPPISASSRTPDPWLAPSSVPSSMGWYPVTSTVIPAGSPAAAKARIFPAPLLTSSRFWPGGYTCRNVVCWSRETYIEFPVEKNELVSARGFAFTTRATAARTAGLWVTSMLAEWKTTTFGGRAPAPSASSDRRLPS